MNGKEEKRGKSHETYDDFILDYAVFFVLVASTALTYFHNETPNHLEFGSVHEFTQTEYAGRTSV